MVDANTNSSSSASNGRDCGWDSLDSPNSGDEEDRCREELHFDSYGILYNIQMAGEHDSCGKLPAASRKVNWALECCRWNALDETGLS